VRGLEFGLGIRRVLRQHASESMRLGAHFGVRRFAMQLGVPCGDVARLISSAQAEVGLHQVRRDRQRVVAAWLAPAVDRDAVLQHGDHPRQFP